MPLDPATIAMFFAIMEILGPKLLECFENGVSKRELVAMVARPNKRQREELLDALPRPRRKALAGFWGVRKQRRLRRPFARVIVSMSLKRAA